MRAKFESSIYNFLLIVIFSMCCFHPSVYFCLLTSHGSMIWQNKTDQTRCKENVVLAKKLVYMPLCNREYHWLKAKTCRLD